MLFFKKILPTFLIIFWICLSCEIFAQIPPEFTKLFKEEQYQEAINVLDASDNKRMSEGRKSYLKGLSYSRLRKYDLAITFFNKAVDENDLTPDLYYEYGQALYADNYLSKAKYQFAKSAGINFNYSASTYYVAYISELLEDDVQAKRNYWKLIKDKRTDKKFLQISLFQYAKIILKMMKKENELLQVIDRRLIRLNINLLDYIPRYVFPLLEKSLAVDRDSPASTEIKQFLYNLEVEFKLIPNVMKNGRLILGDRPSSTVSTNVKYDSNASLTKKSSFLYGADAFAKYDFIAKKRIVIAPELSFSYVKYEDQKTPEVYHNDSTTMSSAIRNKLEHTYNELPATFLLDLEYSTLYKDWKVDHQREYFSKTYASSIGEQLTLIKSGATSFKLKTSRYRDESTYYNSKTSSINVEQYIFLNNGQQLLVASIDVGKMRMYESNLMGTNTYSLRFVYLDFEVFPTYTLQTVFSTLLTDTKEQKALKGYEVNVNPSFDLTKALSDKLRLGVNYSYTQNFSKLETSKYKKHVIGSTLSYSF